MSMHPENEIFLGALDRLQGSGYELEGYLSNHGPMASDALVELGASDAVLEWVDLYKVRLDVEPEPRGPIDPGNGHWWEALGDINRVTDWTTFFTREFTERSWRDVLVTWWPRLLPGLAAAAAHGVIRTAHAVRAINRADTVDDLLLQELGHGLGYWAARYQELPGDEPPLTGNQGIPEALTRVATMEPGRQSDEPGIISQLMLVDHVDGFADALTSIGVAVEINEALTDVTAAAARAFVVHPGPAIPLVHAITSPAAVKLVLPHLPASLHRESLARSVQISAALVAVFSSPKAALPVPTEVMAVNELVGRVVKHGDEHVIKMTEACLREYSHRPDPHYLLAAEAALRNIDPLT